MTFADVMVLFGLFGFCAVMIFSSSKQKRLLLLGAAGLALVGGLIDYFTGRVLAVPVLFIAVIFLGLAFLTTSKIWPPKKRPFVGVFTLLTALIAFLPLFIVFGTVNFPVPQGSHAVGVKDAVVVDAARGQGWDAVSGGPRRILIRAWYPANRNHDAEFAPRYRDAAEGVDMISTTGISRSSRDVSPFAGQFPLVIFSHGYMESIASNVTLMEHLASFGYVVISISHPGETRGIVYPDGTRLPMFKQVAEVTGAADSEKSAKTMELFDKVSDGSLKSRLALVDYSANGELTLKRSPIWVSDYQSVLDALESNNIEGDFNAVIGQIDFSNIGFAGMSMGALTGPWSCDLDERCDAAAALDVIVAAPHLRNSQVRMPMLVLSGGSPVYIGGQDFYYEPYAQAGKTETVHRINFPSAGHMDFTDAALMFRDSARAILPLSIVGSGHGPGRQIMDAQNELVLDFFDTYLKGQKKNFPEAMLAKYSVIEKPDLSPIRHLAKTVSSKEP